MKKIKRQPLLYNEKAAYQSEGGLIRTIITPELRKKEICSLHLPFNHRSRLSLHFRIPLSFFLFLRIFSHQIFRSLQRDSCVSVKQPWGRFSRGAAIGTSQRNESLTMFPRAFDPNFPKDGRVRRRLQANCSVRHRC